MAAQRMIDSGLDTKAILGEKTNRRGIERRERKEVRSERETCSLVMTASVLFTGDRDIACALDRKRVRTHVCMYTSTVKSL